MSEPAITDEELAELWESVKDCPSFVSHRLITALRAERAEVARLRLDAANLSRMVAGVPVQLPPLGK